MDLFSVGELLGTINKVNLYQDELLTVLMEECGETVQEICKIKRFGLHEESHHVRGSSHLTCLENELGDIIGIIDMLIDSDLGLNRSNILAAAERKKIKVVKWMKYKKDNHGKDPKED